jgi:hypothetical protein
MRYLLRFYSKSLGVLSLFGLDGEAWSAEEICEWRDGALNFRC